MRLSNLSSINNKILLISIWLSLNFFLIISPCYMFSPSGIRSLSIGWVVLSHMFLIPLHAELGRWLRAFSFTFTFTLTVTFSFSKNLRNNLTFMLLGNRIHLIGCSAFMTINYFFRVSMLRLLDRRRICSFYDFQKTVV